MADPFAVQFKGRLRFASQFKSRRAKPLDDFFRQSSARKKTGNTAKQRRKIYAWKNADFQNAVSQICLWKNLKRAAVEFSVANQNQFAGKSLAVRRNLDLRFLLAQRFQPGDDIRQRPDFFLHRKVHKLDGARIQTGTGQLREINFLADAVL